MIKVTVGTNTTRKTVIINPDRTVKSVLEENNIDYSRGGIHLDGPAIGSGELNKTFTELGINEDCILTAVVKCDGGLM